MGHDPSELGGLQVAHHQHEGILHLVDGDVVDQTTDNGPGLGFSDVNLLQIQSRCVRVGTNLHNFANPDVKVGTIVDVNLRGWRCLLLLWGSLHLGLRRLQLGQRFPLLEEGRSQLIEGLLGDGGCRGRGRSRSTRNNGNDALLQLSPLLHQGGPDLIEVDLRLGGCLGCNGNDALLQLSPLLHQGGPDLIEVDLRPGGCLLHDLSVVIKTEEEISLSIQCKIFATTCG
mmetsp:Transcript_24657/g.44765  ORF Transcript_24657/g.44765 Transcript_24657/m.44765 type:complete len:229 (-) Transcript_24657:1565-2251(-)